MHFFEIRQIKKAGDTSKSSFSYLDGAPEYGQLQSGEKIPYKKITKKFIRIVIRHFRRNYNDPKTLARAAAVLNHTLESGGMVPNNLNVLKFKTQRKALYWKCVAGDKAAKKRFNSCFYKVPKTSREKRRITWVRNSFETTCVQMILYSVAKEMKIRVPRGIRFIDGLYGDKTRGLTKAIQKELNKRYKQGRRLTLDGVWGPKTAKKLFNFLKKRKEGFAIQFKKAHKTPLSKIRRPVLRGKAVKAQPPKRRTLKRVLKKSSAKEKKDNKKIQKLERQVDIMTVRVFLNAVLKTSVLAKKDPSLFRIIPRRYVSVKVSKISLEKHKKTMKATAIISISYKGRTYEFKNIDTKTAQRFVIRKIKEITKKDVDKIKKQKIDKTRKRTEARKLRRKARQMRRTLRRETSIYRIRRKNEKIAALSRYTNLRGVRIKVIKVNPKDNTVSLEIKVKEFNEKFENISFDKVQAHIFKILLQELEPQAKEKIRRRLDRYLGYRGIKRKLGKLNASYKITEIKKHEISIRLSINGTSRLIKLRTRIYRFTYKDLKRGVASLVKEHKERNKKKELPRNTAIALLNKTYPGVTKIRRVKLKDESEVAYKFNYKGYQLSIELDPSVDTLATQKAKLENTNNVKRVELAETFRSQFSRIISKLREIAKSRSVELVKITVKAGIEKDYSLPKSGSINLPKNINFADGEISLTLKQKDTKIEKEVRIDFLCKKKIGGKKAIPAYILEFQKYISKQFKKLEAGSKSLKQPNYITAIENNTFTKIKLTRQNKNFRFFNVTFNSNEPSPHSRYQVEVGIRRGSFASENAKLRREIMSYKTQLTQIEPFRKALESALPKVRDYLSGKGLEKFIYSKISSSGATRQIYDLTKGRISIYRQYLQLRSSRLALKIKLRGRKAFIIKIDNTQQDSNDMEEKLINAINKKLGVRGNPKLRATKPKSTSTDTNPKSSIYYFSQREIFARAFDKATARKNSPKDRIKALLLDSGRKHLRLIKSISDKHLKTYFIEPIGEKPKLGDFKSYGQVTLFFRTGNGVLIYTNPKTKKRARIKFKLNSDLSDIEKQIADAYRKATKGK